MSIYQRIDQVYEECMKRVDDKKVDPENYMALVVAVMELVEQMTDLDGDGKSDVSFRVVLRLVEHFKDEFPSIVTVLTETTILNLMQVAVKLFKGKYDLGKKWKRLLKKCKFCAKK